MRDPCDFMSVALDLAARAAGDTFPNPLVGAVVVRDGRMIGQGFHRAAGELHAERAALADGVDARGAVLYVTLEPCSHVGRQPPCVDAIVAAGIARVVVGAMDPNPRTAGSGIRRLRLANIEVEVLDDPRCVRAIEDFAVWVRTPLPYIAVKMAASLDGFVSPRRDERYQLTGDAWARELQELRHRHQAVMVGAGTVRIDDPLLTVREGVRRVPYERVVIGGERPLSPQLRLFATPHGYARTIVIVTDRTRGAQAHLASIARIMVAPSQAGGAVDLRAAMQQLQTEFGIVSVLCEGGPTLASALLRAGLAQRLYWVLAPRLLAGENAVAVLGGDRATPLPGVRLDSVRSVGDDVLLSGSLHV
jgi:diaminohydroxyphosphoribosylaminopyrimidine deaminase/5-amino-6-(5-phosphoribosylamino)uracil reductase